MVMERWGQWGLHGTLQHIIMFLCSAIVRSPVVASMKHISALSVLAALVLSSSPVAHSFVPPQRHVPVRLRIHVTIHAAKPSDENDTSNGKANRKRGRNAKGESDGGYNVVTLSPPLDGDGDVPPHETLQGGPALIFTMARRMLVWDDENYVGQNDTYRTGAEATPSSALPMTEPLSSEAAVAESRPLPRWHPHGGISDVNPSFRSAPPAMNNAGYAASIRRNSRKRNKPSLWRHALRTYDRMKLLEEEENIARSKDAKEQGIGGEVGMAGRPKVKVRRSAPHYESAIVAAGKLGLWEEALRIFEDAAGNLHRKKYTGATAGGDHTKADSQTEQQGALSSETKKLRRRRVTDNMVLAVVRAAIRGGKLAEMRKMDVDSRRVPLDRVRDIVLSMEDRYGILVDATHVNPLAAAYAKLGLTEEASRLIQACLPDRKIRCETDDDVVLNINDVQSKSRESYALLVSGGVAKGDWESAVQALSQMTEAGLYPTDRQVSVWNESAAKRERRGRNKRRSWKKRRDQYWLQSLQ